MVFVVPSLAAQEKTKTDESLERLKARGTIVETLCLDGYQFLVASNGNRGGVNVTQIYEMYNHFNPPTPKRCKTKPAYTPFKITQADNNFIEDMKISAESGKLMAAATE